MENLKICVMSDLHGYLPRDIEPFDLMLLGGDNVNLHYQSSKMLTIAWFLEDFANWINKLPFKDKYSKVVLPLPRDEYQRYVSRCDYLASRVYLNVKFDKLEII